MSAAKIESIKNTVSISMFNKGYAGRIFEEVKKNGAKVVTKNNVPVCVLLSPEEYVQMKDKIDDAELLALAEERMEHFDPATLITSEELYKELGITEEDVKCAEEVEIE